MTFREDEHRFECRFVRSYPLQTTVESPMPRATQYGCSRYVVVKGPYSHTRARARHAGPGSGRAPAVLPVLESQVSDSNVITPGTEFMFELSNALKSYIVKRLESDPGWKEIKVILSDATVPGEGEHKIMSFIRTLRSLPKYNPNTRHCLYGLDADLIMLALATHEIHFSILREYVGNVPDQKPDSESSLLSIIKIAEAVGYGSDKSTEQGKKWFDIQDKSRSMAILPQNFEFVHVWILREYLELDMQITDAPEKFVFDIERIVDDFIFMCLFVGNDFLPHMPTLEIREVSIERSIFFCARCFYSHCVESIVLFFCFKVAM
ncbi:5'-3' exoribonuclease 2-like [Silene latifolia]|uniref:5'-3' exoribonuclease 2-like n=1 Tax=Silene latifolia TaxID=37657 RepID=UPI003D76D7AF